MIYCCGGGGPAIKNDEESNGKKGKSTKINN